MRVLSLPVLPLFSVHGRKERWSVLRRAGFLQLSCLFINPSLCLGHLNTAGTRLRAASLLYKLIY